MGILAADTYLANNRWSPSLLFSLVFVKNFQWEKKDEIRWENRLAYQYRCCLILCHLWNLNIKKSQRRESINHKNHSFLQILSVLPVVTDDILVRRLKNRERQRRYRARKRLESDMKRSCLLGQNAAFRNGSQFNLSNVQLMSCERSFRYKNIETVRLEALMYSGRNWKREARETHSSSELRNPLRLQLLPMRSPSGTTLYRQKHPNQRRNWKADARSKNRERCKEWGTLPAQYSCLPGMIPTL